MKYAPGATAPGALFCVFVSGKISSAADGTCRPLFFPGAFAGEERRFRRGECAVSGVGVPFPSGEEDAVPAHARGLPLNTGNTLKSP